MKRYNPNLLALVATAALVLACLLIGINADRANGVSGNETECVPSEAWTETITVVDVPAHTTVEFDHWQRYSWTGGPHASDDPPAFPSDDWQANTASDPHGTGAPGAYFRSHGNSGNGDWFYLEMVMKTVEHPAVTHEEYIEHPAVTCPEDPTDPPITEQPCDRPVIGGPCAPVTEPHTPEIIDAPVKRDRPATDDAPLPETGA